MQWNRKPCGHPPKSCGCCYFQTFSHTTPRPGRPSSSAPSTLEGPGQVPSVTCSPRPSLHLAFVHSGAARVLRNHHASAVRVFWRSCSPTACLRLSLLAALLPQAFLSSPAFGASHVLFGVASYTLCPDIPKSTASCLKAVSQASLCFPRLAQNPTHESLSKCLRIKAGLLLKYLDENLFRECPHRSVFWSFSG